MFVDCHVIVQFFVTLRTTNDSTRSRNSTRTYCLLTLLPRHIPPPPPIRAFATPSLAEVEMHKVMHPAGGQHYETVLRETDFHMGPDSENGGDSL